MKLLHYVEIENFKRYGEVQRLELDHPSVLIGPNNCGKTSALQAIALWSIGLKTWVAESENSKAEKRTGKALNRLNMLSVPVPKTRHLWNNLKTTKRELRITVGVEFKGQIIPVTMEFTHHSSDELVYCKPAAVLATDDPAFAAAAALEISLLYPMSGITADEAVILPKRIEYLMGRGSTAEVLRNICLLLAEGAPDDWKKVTELMRRLFHVRLGTPKVNDNGGVDLAYTQDGTVGEMDLGLSGRGFQQMLLIFSHLFLHKKGVLLIDEPDAHLEILRQRQVFTLLRDIAHRNGSQVILVTHSEVVLSEALDTNLTLILDGRADDLAEKQEIRDALKHYGAEHYVRARETGHVLYVDGSTDIDMLRAFARKLGHPVADLLEEEGRLNVYYLQDNFPGPARDSHEQLERVEGGFGLTAREHFRAIRSMLPSLNGLAIYDHDGRSRKETGGGGLTELQWRRYEPENYFVSPQSLERWVEKHLGQEELFAGSRKQVMNAMMADFIFNDEPQDLDAYLGADLPTRKALWRAKTQHIKLSRFAEEYFRRIAAATATPMLLRKGLLHELVAICDAEEFNGDVKAKLDALMKLLSPP
jgi:ABC-type branched-subunit amino acid transport system ATPase component